MKKNTPKKKAEKPDPVELAFAKLGSSPLSELAEMIPRVYQNNSYPMAKGDWAYVTSRGRIYLNPHKEGSTGEWTYVLAHCLLHLGMGHLQWERMDDHAWHAACDIVVTNFLIDSHIGTPPMDTTSALAFRGKSEEQIYDRLCQMDDLSQYEALGLMSQGRTDMQWAGESRFDFMEIFAQSLQLAMTQAIQIAGGLSKEEREELRDWKTAYHRAKEWFVSSYPLLGALAAGFQLVDDPATVRRMRIEVAAVHPQLQEIYINPNCSMSANEWKFVLAHEFLHAALRHDVRREERDPILWNVAYDYVINGWLAEMNVGLMPEFSLFDARYKGMSAESVYDVLWEDLKHYRNLDPKDILYGDDRWWDSRDGGQTDAFYRSAIQRGLDYHQEKGRGRLPGDFVEEVRAISRPPIAWDVALAKWFDEQFQPLTPYRTYARLSRRQSSTPDIPRPAWANMEERMEHRIFGVLLDTSGSMDRELLAAALGSIASYSQARDVYHVRVVFCDAAAYDQGVMHPEDIAGTVKIRGRGGTKLQPGIDLLDGDKHFPKDAPLLIITDGECDRLNLRGRTHAFLIPADSHLPFAPKGPVFRLR